MKTEVSKMQDTDGIHRQVEVLGNLSKELDENFALRSLGAEWKHDRVKT
jgi:hypothetical protein